MLGVRRASITQAAHKSRNGQSYLSAKGGSLPCKIVLAWSYTAADSIGVAEARYREIMGNLYDRGLIKSGCPANSPKR